MYACVYACVYVDTKHTRARVRRFLRHRSDENHSYSDHDPQLMPSTVSIFDTGGIFPVGVGADGSSSSSSNSGSGSVGDNATDLATGSSSGGSDIEESSSAAIVREERGGGALVVLMLGSPEVDSGTGNTVFSLSAEVEVSLRFVFCPVLLSLSLFSLTHTLLRAVASCPSMSFRLSVCCCDLSFLSLNSVFCFFLFVPLSDPVSLSTFLPLNPQTPPLGMCRRCLV